MRILLHTNSPATAQTGYGVQARLFTPRWRDRLGHDVAVSAFYGAEGATQIWEGMPIFPKFADPYGLDIVGAHADRWQADIVMTLIDAWVMRPEVLRRWVPWFPVDHDDKIPPPVLDRVRQAYQPIVFSRHAERLAQDAGLDVRYVPHGVDTGIFRPLDQGECRDRLGLPRDRFLISAVMANKGLPSRKAWPQQLEAYAQFAKKHRDALLYLHTLVSQEMGGVNIRECLQAFGVPDDQVVVADQYRILTGIPDDVMAGIYSASDVLLNCSMGEGFGVPILEAQACGCPVITGGWTAMPELTWAGWMVDREDATPVWTAQAGYQHQPHVDAIVGALNDAYKARGNEQIRARAVDGAQAYDADHVTDTHWKPVLAEIADRIDAEKGTAALPAPEVLGEAA